MTIRNDATRLRVESEDPRRPRAVVARQGQVLLDTDLDQQAAALLGRIETETADILNSAGKLVYPAGTTGFQISANGPPANFSIGAGHAYLDGWLLENPAVATLATQPHPRTGDTVSSPSVIALKALVRHVDPVEEPGLADVALGDAHASGRALNDWQVFPLAIAGGGNAGLDCGTAPGKPEWAALTAPSQGAMSVIRQAAAPSTDPCSLVPGGGYSRLENLLYRIEVHGGTPKANVPQADGPRFGLDGLRVKLSRRNASLMARIVGIVGEEVTVEPAALDARAWFAPGAYAELVNVHDDVDPRPALASERLFRVALATDERVVLDAPAGAVAATNAAADGSWFLRLWDAFADASGVATVAAAGANSQSIDLGDGLSIKFHNGAAATFRRGDYWTFAARADGSVAWPESAPGVPEQMTPHGPQTRYAVLATMTGTTTAPGFDNCSVPFASLTDMLLFYRGGDGQSVFAGAGAPPWVPLPQKLRVAVMRGETPVAGARLLWSPAPGAPNSRIDGQLCTAVNPRPATTGPDGICEVEWAIDRAQPFALHRVQAVLETSPAENLPHAVQFAAIFSTAEQTSYRPGKCNHLANVDNVQDALDTLCSKIGDERHRSLLLTRIELFGGRQPFPLIRDDLIANGLIVDHDSFVSGISFGFDSPGFDLGFSSYDPIVEVELDLPYPGTDMDRLYWLSASKGGITGAFGFRRLRLDGTVQMVPRDGDRADAGLLWLPSEQARRFLGTANLHLWGHRILDGNDAMLRRGGWNVHVEPAPVLCRIRLRSAHIWAENRETRERLYLNAEHLGTLGNLTKRELLLKERDPQRAADLDMFIYLKLRG